MLWAILDQRGAATHRDTLGALRVVYVGVIKKSGKDRCLSGIIYVYIQSHSGTVRNA